MLIAGLIRLAIPAGAGLLLACSDYPAGPSEAPDPARGVSGAPGTYVMSFMRTGEGIVLQGQVTYAATGLPATGGEVKFFVCKAQGGYAPASACQNGSGRWSPAFTSWVPVISAGPWAGYARALFDDCPPGVTMGFYFQYRGLRTGIADGKSAPADYTEPL